MAAVLGQDVQDVSCVVLPLGTTTLLLPNVCVAEILTWRRTTPFDGQPDWCAGLLGWRGVSLPVVSFERFNGDRDGSFQGRCLVVMNRSSRSEGRPFYALISQGMPRMIQLSGDDVSSQGGQATEAEALRARVGAEDVVIPRLSALEAAVNGIG